MATAAAKLLVLSVFAQSPRNTHWIKFHYHFLDQTSPAYDHVVYLHRADPALFPRSQVLGSVETNGPAPEVHGELLQILLEYARTVAYDYYLFLDSDAFPVTPDWLSALVARMGDAPFAAPVRFENLDLFPHPCAFFVRGENVHRQELDFRVGPIGNLLQQTVQDPGCRIPLSMCYPLVRTNVFNPHPLLAALYGHWFYHHGCGSRAFAMRSATTYKYYDHVVTDHANLEAALFKALTSAPDAFIQRLKTPPASGLFGV
jgi:hypothetical protein